MNITQCLDTGR